MKLKGLDQILKNIKKATNDLQRRGEAGVLKAAILVRREGQIETPVRTGFLINSWYGPDLHQSNRGPVAEIGLTASYSVFVHENVGAHFTKPGSKAKFLEDPLFRNESRIAEIIRGEYK